MNFKGPGVLIICLALGQCATGSSTYTETGGGDTTITNPATVDENYEAFISRFNADTVFQKARIKYNLSKYYDKYVNMSISAIDTNEFRISSRMSDKVIVRVTNRKDTTYWIQLCFTKQGGNWYLTDYLDTYND